MAEIFKLEAKPRTGLGTHAARQLRKQGLIPCVLMHKKDAPKNLVVSARELERSLSKGARLLDLQHAEGQDRVFIKEIQWDPLGEKVVHADFTKIALDEKLTLEVALILKGRPVGVVEEGATLDQFVKTLEIQCLPTAIPDRIEVDVTHMKKDDTLKLSDVKAPEGVTFTQDADLVLAVVQEHKILEAAPAAVPGAEAAPAEPEVIKKERAVEEEEEK